MFRPLLLSALVFVTTPAKAEQSLYPINESAFADDPEYVDARCRAFLYQAFMIGTYYRGHRGTKDGRVSFEAFRFAQRIRDMRGLLGVDQEPAKWSVKKLSQQYRDAFGPIQFPEAITSTPPFRKDRRTCEPVIEYWTKTP